MSLELLHDGVVECIDSDQIADVSDELGHGLMVEVVLGQPGGLRHCKSQHPLNLCLLLVLLGNAASPCPGRPCHAGLAGVEDEDEEVGLLVLSSLLSSRSLDRLGIDDRWDLSSSKSFESRVRLDPDER